MLYRETVGTAQNDCTYSMDTGHRPSSVMHMLYQCCGFNCFADDNTTTHCRRSQVNKQEGQSDQFLCHLNRSTLGYAWLGQALSDPASGCMPITCKASSGTALLRGDGVGCTRTSPIAAAIQSEVFQDIMVWCHTLLLDSFNLLKARNRSVGRG